MPGQQRPQRNNEKPNGKTTTAITPGHHRAPHEAEFKSQPPLPSADSARLPAVDWAGVVGSYRPVPRDVHLVWLGARPLSRVLSWVASGPARVRLVAVSVIRWA